MVNFLQSLDYAIDLLYYQCISNLQVYWLELNECEIIIKGKVLAFAVTTSFSSVQFSSITQSCPTLCDPMNHSMPGLPIHHQLPESTQTHSTQSVMPSNHLILCHPLLLLSPIPPSIRVFSNESALHIRWPMYWSFSFNISPSNEHPGLISFRMDCLDLLAVQGTLKSLLQHHSLKASILVLSFLYSPTLTSIHDHWTNHSLD